MPVGFRKYIVAALAILTCLFLFTRHHNNVSLSSALSTAESSAAAAAARLGAAAADKVAPLHTTTAYADSKSGAKSEGATKEQKPLAPGPNRPLTERLRYQYPYNPEGKFPAYIWQTWKTTPSSGDFADNLRPQEASWTTLHPGFVHEVVTDDVAHNLVRYLYSSVPEVLEAYEAMPIAVLKADFFRYLILLARGGIYSDIDTEALKSAGDWLPKDISPSAVGLIVGVEADPDRPDWQDWYSRRIQFCQWTIQAKPGHPVLRSIVASITEETLARKKKGFASAKQLHKEIIEYTGPARWTDTVFDYMNDKEFFKIEDSRVPGSNITWREFTGMKTPKMVGDLVVLPITSFSPDVGTMGAGDRDDPMAFVKHDFEGSWKESWEHVKPVVGE